MSFVTFPSCFCLKSKDSETFIYESFLNGLAARKVQVGDTVVIINYAQMTPEEAKTFIPAVIFPDEYNRLPEHVNA